MFVAVKKHNRARIVQFVHLVKIGHLANIDQIDDSKVFDFLRSFVEDLIYFGFERFLEFNLTNIESKKEENMFSI